MATAANWRDKLRQSEGSDRISDSRPPAGTVKTAKSFSFGSFGTIGRQSGNAARNGGNEWLAVEERAALVEYGANVPRDWAEGFARLNLATPPMGFDDRRWRALIDDGGFFLDRWGAEAVRLGWTAKDVFGVHPLAPIARYDAMGLVLLIGGGSVVSVRQRSATIKTKSSGATLTYLRTPRQGAIALWELSPGRAELCR